MSRRLPRDLADLESWLAPPPARRWLVRIFMTTCWIIIAVMTWRYIWSLR